MNLTGLALPGFDDVVEMLKKKGMDTDEIMSWLNARHRALNTQEADVSPLAALLNGRGGEVAAAAMFYQRPLPPETKGDDPTPPPPKVVNRKDYTDRPLNDQPPPMAA